MQQTKNGYLPSLDGWRAIAISAVICAHDPDVHGLSFLSTRRVHQVGWAGVDLFFAISGLLICSRLLEEERSRGRISLRSFYTRRAFRILPAAYVFLAVALLLGLAGQLPYSVAGTVAAVFMIRNYWGVYSGVPPQELYTDHFWSLSVEEHFYLLLPSILVFVKRRVAVIAVLSAIAYAWLLYFSLTQPIKNNLTMSRTDLRIAGLLMPALLAIGLASKKGKAIAERWLRPWFWIGLICLLATAVHNFPLGARIAVVSVCFPFLIASTMIHPESLSCRILEWPPIRFVGRLSYGIYLWQQIFMLRSPSEHGAFAELQKFPFNYLALALCATASYFLLEKPLIRFGNRYAPPASAGRNAAEEAPTASPSFSTAAMQPPVR